MREAVFLDGRVRLIEGDCRDVLPSLGPVGAVIADPPYGISYSFGSSNRKRGKAVYDAAFDDTRDYVAGVCVPAVTAALALANGVGAVTPGSPCLWLYPEPATLGGFYQPAAVGMNRWGYANLSPVCFYGKDPRSGKALSATVITVTEPPSSDEHPCAKPQRAMDWLVGKVSLDDAIILDPFMGSGTTGVAAVKLGRRFIGIELEARFFDTACRRIEEATRQGNLFDPAALSSLGKQG